MAWPTDLPRFRLFDPPSPFAPLERLSAALGGRAELWIKREDLLPLAFGGNKLRNLEFLVGEALVEGADVLVTSGRSWSNHCRLTAAAGARAGLEVHAVVNGPPAEADTPNVRLIRLLGAEVHVAGSDDRAERQALVERTALDLSRAGRTPFVIPVGGSGPAGVVGQALAGVEIVEQAREIAAEPDVIVVPAATGGTQAGLIAGLRAAGSGARVVGVTVARPASELLPLVDALLGALGGTAEEIVLDDAFLAPGYGRRNAAADEAARLLARTEGIVVDPIYTAKPLAWLVAAVRGGQLDGRRVVFWHAGGTVGLFEPIGP